MKKIINIILTGVLVIQSLATMAGGTPPPPPPDASAPIDTGAFILLALIAGYGYYQLRQNKQIEVK